MHWQKSLLSSPLGIDDYPSFRDTLSRANHVVVVGDNNGEIVFDRLLIEEMAKVRPCRYTYIVRGRPVINDVTIEDARSVGMHHVAELVQRGLRRARSAAVRLFQPECVNSWVELTW